MERNYMGKAAQLMFLYHVRNEGTWRIKMRGGGDHCFLIPEGLTHGRELWFLLCGLNDYSQPL